MSDSTLLTVLCASSDSALHEWIFIIYSFAASGWALHYVLYWFFDFNDEVGVIQDDQIEDGEEETYSREPPELWKDEQLYTECDDGACGWNTHALYAGLNWRLLATI